MNSGKQRKLNDHERKKIEAAQFFDHLILEKIPICAFYLVVKDHKKQHGKTYTFQPCCLLSAF